MNITQTSDIQMVLGAGGIMTTWVMWIVFPGLINPELLLSCTLRNQLSTEVLILSTTEVKVEKIPLAWRSGGRSRLVCTAGSARITHPQYKVAHLWCKGRFTCSPDEVIPHMWAQLWCGGWIGWSQVWSVWAVLEWNQPSDKRPSDTWRSLQP